MNIKQKVASTEDILKSCTVFYTWLCVGTNGIFIILIIHDVPKLLYG